MTQSGGSLDANVILRLLLNDLPDQHKAVIELFHNNPSQFDVADTAIIEVVFVLCRAYDFSRSQTAEAINGLMQLKELNCNRILFENSLPLFLGHPGLSFEDCCLAVYAKLKNAEPLWTLDRKLANQVSSAQLVKV
jgi:predicted nucleic-acid-binding protein